MRIRVLAPLAALALVSGCYSAQTTSGRGYLDRWNAAQGERPVAEITAEEAGFEETLRAAASVEPLLRFPARLGIARLHNGRLSAIPPGEGAYWLALREGAQGYGEFVEISPLAASFALTAAAAQPAGAASRPRPYGSAPMPAGLHPIQQIRIGAARQHVDAVFVYEVFTKTDRRGTPLVSSILDLTVIGGLFIPNRKVDIEAFAQTALIDVRNGYIYGEARGTADQSLVVTTLGGRDRTDHKADIAAEAAVAEMMGEVGAMLAELAAQLSDRGAADGDAE